MLQAFFLLLGIALASAGLLARARIPRPTAFFDGDRVRVFALRRAHHSAAARSLVEVGSFLLLAALVLEACR
jgi:hypothetical protein